ncbi:SprT-like domain-containing protein [Cupriavidus sp. TMH.W2]|uniref:SprT-like domain-containing protein n=1 Tax=Cupriavidus sp. TMH.W2 TaxID=3434465 RepID=UPI003D76B0E3
MSNVRPTKEAYEALQFAYDFLNERLFAGVLQGCLITLNRKGRSLGHFSPKRFVNRGGIISDEINLNPVFFGTRPVEDVLSTLAHEQCHQWREYDGEPPRRSYHDKKWAAKMLSIGLQPSSTGSPGGKTVGETMSHYIVPDGPFILACKELLTHTFGIVWFDRYPEFSRKDYTYAGTVEIPAKSAKPHGSLGIDASTTEVDGEEDDDDETGGKGLSVEVPVFSPIPISNGLEVVRPTSAAGGDRISGGRTASAGVSVDRSNRVKYTCGGCGTNLWAKPSVNVVCGDCQKRFEAH